MLRVGDLKRSIDFYTNVLGMQVLRKTILTAASRWHSWDMAPKTRRLCSS
jgi:catechol 2,3-dioxygenase-like lactoylglutathione lyase family enzyme